MQLESADVVWWLKAVVGGTFGVIVFFFPFVVLHRLKKIQYVLEEIRDNAGDSAARRKLDDYRRRATEKGPAP